MSIRPAPLDPTQRRLLPLLPTTTEPPSTSSASPVATGIHQKRKKHNVPAACEACRLRKSKCTAERPKCHTCAVRGTDCLYATIPTETHSQALKRKYNELRDQKSPAEELIDLLRSKPEKESLEIFRRIRASDNIEAILRHVQDGDLLMQLSLAPDTRRRYEFPYVSDMPAFVLVPDNLYLDSLIYDATFQGRQSRHLESDAKSPTNATRYHNPYLKPYYTAEIGESLLSDVTVSGWTSVTSDNQLLRRLLGAYFLYQHPWTAAFHKDYFLEDMATGATQFCSSLLVNAILAVVCHMYPAVPNRTEFWDPNQLGNKFLTEAQRLWDMEIGNGINGLTTIQAAINLDVLSVTIGMNKIGTTYLLHAIAMAQDTQLFKTSVDENSEKVQRARAFTAWGLYSWQSWQCYYFSRSPYIKDPPEFPLPNPTVDQDWYGEIWVRYPLGETMSPVHLGTIMKANLDLHLIMNDMAFGLFGNPKPQATVEHILEFKSRLDMWFNDLPDPLTPKKIIFPNHIKIHLEYWGNLITLFQPLVIEANAANQPVADMDMTFQELISHAKVRFQTLLRLYYLRHSFDVYDPMVMSWLTLLGDMALEKLNTEAEFTTLRAFRSTLILCAKTLYSQEETHHIALLVYHTLCDRINSKDLELLHTYLTSRNENFHQHLMAEYVQCQWPLPMIRTDKDPSTTNLEYLVKEYERISLESPRISSQEDTPNVGQYSNTPENH